MRDPTRRINRWVAKSNTERTKATLDDMQPDMVRNYAAATAEMRAIETVTARTGADGRRPTTRS